MGGGSARLTDYVAQAVAKFTPLIRNSVTNTRLNCLFQVADNT